MIRVSGAQVLAGVALVVAIAAPARANKESDALRARAAVDTYNLDRDQAIAGFRKAIAVDPLDAPPIADWRPVSGSALRSGAAT